MSHVSPKGKRQRVKPNCRKGVHSYGRTQEIGGGIARRICDMCSAVSIDLSGAYEMEANPQASFVRRPAEPRGS